MTNEEKILNAFPNATARIIENKDFRYIEVEQNDEWIADFSIEWWHSEYKEPKTGHWKRISMDKYVQHAQYYYRCSECGEDVIGEHNYCPNCGCRMFEPQETKQPEISSYYGLRSYVGERSEE